MNSNADNAHESVPVCVIVVTYNSELFIERCLEAIQSQTLKPDQVVVIDNGSTDETIRLIQDRFKDIAVIDAGSNLGFAVANNMGIEQAPDNGYVALVNPDAFLERNWLEKMIDAARRNT